MPHINYRRGETRTFVVRRTKTHPRGRWRRHAARKGLGRIYWGLVGWGGFGCSCCHPGKDPKTRQAVAGQARSRQKRADRKAERDGDYDVVSVFILELTETEVTFVSDKGVEVWPRWRLGDDSLEQLSLVTGFVEILVPAKGR